MDILSEGRKVFDTEISALEKTRDTIDDIFVEIVKWITKCEGKVIITGMGKPGHIATKLAATFSSLGTPSFYLHPGEAMHGDLGMISKNDIVIVISYSGESDEIISIIPNIRIIGARIVGITANKSSTLAKEADLVQILPEFEEACCLGLAPTSSTTAELCYGDALAVVASRIYGFSDVDFGKLHPAGSLGKKLVLKVKDIMTRGDDNAIIGENNTIKDAIVEMSRKGLGIVSVCDDDLKLCGVLTDGDLRRLMEKNADIYKTLVKNVMTQNPISTEGSVFAIDALRTFKELNITAMPVIKDKKVIGVVRLQDIVGVGIVG